MDRLRLIRGLRIAVTTVCGIACALLAVMWARSYHSEDRASGHISGSYGVQLYSSRGWMVCSRNTAVDATQHYPWKMDVGKEHWLHPADDRLKFANPLHFLRGASFASITAPHWVLIGLSGAVALVTSTVRLKFSLRTLLIVTTAIAVLLGVVVWESR